MSKHSVCNNGQYEEALQEKSFFRLLAYPCKLVLWQMHHPADSVTIGKIGSHLHGLTHDRCLRPIFHGHPVPHGSCGEKCRVIDRWMRKTLGRHVIFILSKRSEKLSQQPFPLLQSPTAQERLKSRD